MNDTNEIRQRNLERLKRMRDEGILTADEFQRERTEVFRLNPVIQAEVAPVQEANIDQSEANDTTEDYIYGTAHEEPNQSEYEPARSVGEWFWVVPLATLSILLVATGYIYLSKARVHTGLYEVTARTLNCRAEPTSSSSIVTQFTQGQEISVIDKQNDWLNVNADNDCWVSSEFAQKKETKSNNNDTENAPALSKYLGKYPSEPVQGVSFWRHPIVRRKVEQFIGDAKTVNLILDGGVESRIEAAGEPYLFAYACQPHNCNSHNWAVSISLDGKDVRVCYFNQYEGRVQSGWYSDRGVSGVESCEIGD
jgi:hypothetical protein